MPHLVIPVTDTDSAIVAARSYLKHNPSCDITTYTSDPSHVIQLKKAELNPVLTSKKPIENRIINDLMRSTKDDLYGILLTQYSFTRSRIIPLEGDHERNWDIAARPLYPFMISDIDEIYDAIDPMFKLYRKTSNFYFSKDIIAFNLRRLRKLYPNIAPSSDTNPYHELNIKMRTSQRGVIPGECFSKPETVIHENMLSSMLLRHQHRLHKNFIVAFDEKCLYWDTKVHMKILMQLNLRDYLECCLEYQDLISSERIDNIGYNIRRQEKRFGPLIDAFSVYDPEFLN